MESTKRPWYRRIGLFITVGLILLFVLWFWWESYTTDKKEYVTDLLKNAANSAFQSTLARVDPNSYEQEDLNGGPSYLVPQFSPYTDRIAGNNALNLQSTFSYYLTLDQGIPLYEIQSFGIDQFYDQVGITVSIKYELFAGLTDSTYVHVTEKVPIKLKQGK